MINKLIVGRYLEMPRFDNKPLPPSAAMKARVANEMDKYDDMDHWANHFVEVDGRNYMISESTGVFTKTSEVKDADKPHEKEHRNFRWLPWIPGKISYIPISGAEVLTGPFTGCWAVVFKMGGDTYFGHIGTDLSATTENSIQVKKAWNRAIESGTVVPLRACNPASKDVIGSSFSGVPTIYSACGPDGVLHVMVTEKDASKIGANEKIVKLEKPTPIERPAF